MKKGIISILLVTCFAAVSGCTNQETAPDPGNTEDEAVAESRMASDTAAEAETDGSENELEMIVNWEIFMACSPYGCYEIGSFSGDYTGNILYTDVATRQRIFLSPDLSADHNDPSDPSWVENTHGGCGLFAMDDTLFMCRTNVDDTPGELYRMDLDGRNRQSIVTFTDYNAPTGGIASDGQDLYTILQKQDKQWLVRICTDSGKIEPLKEMGGDVAFLVSAYGDNLVLKEIHAEDKDSEDPMAPYYSQVHRISQYNITDGTEKEILSWQHDTMTEEYSGEYIYLLDVDNDCLKEVCLSTGEERMIVDSLSSASVNVEEIGSFYPVYDQHLIFGIVGDTGEFAKMGIDLRDGKVFTLEPYTQSLDAYSRQHLGIIGEFGDEFLVTSGTLEVPVDSFDPAGNPIVTDVLMSKLSVIKKEDFWNNRFDAMEPVEDVFLEVLN